MCRLFIPICQSVCTAAGRTRRMPRFGLRCCCTRYVLTRLSLMRRSTRRLKAKSRLFDIRFSAFSRASIFGFACFVASLTCERALPLSLFKRCCSVRAMPLRRTLHSVCLSVTLSDHSLIRTYIVQPFSFVCLFLSSRMPLSLTGDCSYGCRCRCGCVTAVAAGVRCSRCTHTLPSPRSTRTAYARSCWCLTWRPQSAGTVVCLSVLLCVHVCLCVAV